MKKRTRYQLDDDDFRETMSRSSSPRDQILFPREGRIFFLFLNILGLVFSRLQNTPTNTEEKSNRRKDSKEEVVLRYIKKRTLNDNRGDGFVHAKLRSTRSRVLFRKLSHDFQVLRRRTFAFRHHRDGRVT